MKQLENQTIWITGASSGIGEALAIELSKLPVRLILSSRRKAELERVKALCPDTAQVKILPLDLTETETHSGLVEQAINLFGQIDILINNGGISQRSLVKDTLLSVDRQLMEVNYFGTVSLTKAILPYFLERKSGQIVVVTSLTGKFGTPYRSGYAASKHALHGFYDSMRAELEDQGISVTIAAPGFVKTNISINAFQGDGTRLNQMDHAQANGLSAEACAKKILKATARKKREVYIGRESYGVYVKRFFPGLFAKIIKRAKVR